MLEWFHYMKILYILSILNSISPFYNFEFGTPSFLKRLFVKLSKSSGKGKSACFIESPDEVNFAIWGLLVERSKGCQPSPGWPVKENLNHLSHISPATKSSSDPGGTGGKTYKEN